MRIYVTGPCSGYPDDNFPAFYEAAGELREAGYVPLDPTEGSKPISAGRRDAAWLESDEYQAVLGRGMDLLESAEGLALLPGWSKSNGARKEHFRATCLGLRIGSVEQWLEWDTPTCIRWKGEPGLMPTQSYSGDAGFDLKVSEDCRILVGQMQDVPLGVSVELPPGVWALLTGRSSTIRKRGILVAQGIIDQGYRGPLFAACHNLSEHVVDLTRGERVAQLIPMSLVSAGLGLRRVEELGSSERGEAAFGSSGGFATGRWNSLPYPGEWEIERSTQPDLD